MKKPVSKKKHIRSSAEDKAQKAFDFVNVLKPLTKDKDKFIPLSKIDYKLSEKFDSCIVYNDENGTEISSGVFGYPIVVRIKNVTGGYELVTADKKYGGNVLKFKVVAKPNDNYFMPFLLIEKRYSEPTFISGGRIVTDKEKGYNITGYL